MNPRNVLLRARWYVLLALLLSQVSSQALPSPLTSPCPVVFPTARIVGGTFINSSAMVAFTKPSKDLLCSGALITPTQVLTAAHCIVTPFDTALISSTNGMDGTAIPVLFSKSNRQLDISVVTLSQPTDVKPMRILTNPFLPTPWSFLRTQGYGKQSFNPFPQDLRLRFVDTPVISPELCKELWDRDSELYDIGILSGFPKDWVCSSYLESASCSPCQGDSGGPLLAFLKGNPVIVGVVSTGKYCNAPDLPSLASRVTSSISWLDELGVKYKGVKKLSEVFVDNRAPNAASPTNTEAAGVSNTTGNADEANGEQGPRIVIETVEVGLSRWAIAGIVIGILVSVAAVVLMIVVFVRRRRNGGKADMDEGGEDGQGTSGVASSPLQRDQPSE